MRTIINSIYRFLPVQLLLLHFRKYQLLLIFWYVMFATVSGHFADVFGAYSLFLAPEYRGAINFFSMLLVGGATAIFIMAWHITTFIVHSSRVPFLGATRHAFIKYCINNSLLPLIYLILYSIIAVRYQLFNEHANGLQILRFQVGFYFGFLLVLVASFAYFFRVDRDLLKLVLSKITNPARIREIIPYDSLDYEIDIVRADTYVTGRFKIRKCKDLEAYSPRIMHIVLRKHHRNAITATIFALFILILSGIFMEDPRLRIPAGAGFLILFSIVMGVVGAVKYFLRSWELIGWLSIILLLSGLIKYNVVDLRSIAYGLDYHTAQEQKPIYDYAYLQQLFTRDLYDKDRHTEEQRLTTWKNKRGANQPLVVISLSGGGSRAAYWSFRTLQYLDSATNGKLFDNTVMITGASGGMIAAAYWRELHDAQRMGKLKQPYSPAYQENIGKDLLNAIIFSFASVDLISPFNKISVAGYSYTKDRGYAMEQELINNTEGILGRRIRDYRAREASADIPAMIINGTIVNDGRRLMISGLPVSYLTRPETGVQDTTNTPIDAVDFAAFFKGQDPYNMRLTSALRMNATFPYILPVVRLPSRPEMNVMDAGLRDNFGVEVAVRYLHVMRHWLESNTNDVILLQIRDTREHELFPATNMNTMDKMITDPVFVIQNKWESFQSYYHSYLKDYAIQNFNGRLHVINMQYIPDHNEKTAALNFHVTRREKQDLYSSIYNPINKRAADSVIRILSR